MKNIQLSVAGKVIAAVILSWLTMSCGGRNIREFPVKKSIESDTLSALKSAQPIDRGDTYEVYFNLLKSSGCLKITVTAEITTGGIQSREKTVPVFFIIEKGVPVSGFASKVSHIYSSAGKNFDQSWIPGKNALLCSVEQDPVLSLKNGDLFRIRFASFDSVYYRIRIDVEAEEGGEIRFTDKP